GRADRDRVFEALFRVTAEPQTLGRYVVQGTLGSGGMGTVLRGFDPQLDRRVAIKVLHREVDDKHTARLVREAQAMAKLSHPNVVQVFEAGQVEGQTFVAMELVRGQTLREWFQQEPRPHWRRCVEVLCQAGEGLAAAHDEGLIHRDFKPGNAMIDDKGRVRVLDFGLARQVEAIDEAQIPTDPEDVARLLEHSPVTLDSAALAVSEPDTTDDADAPRKAHRLEPSQSTPSALRTPLTRTGAVLGTPAYMPLEQLRGVEADARSDQFSFCVTLWEAVYGRRPFSAPSLMALAVQIAQGDLPPPPKGPKGTKVPAALRRILVRGLARDPAERWPSMPALLTELRQLLAPRRRRGLVVGLVVGLAAMGAAVAVPQYLAMQQRCTGAPQKLEGVWDPERRQQVQDALLGTALPYAPNTWDRVQQQLDDYATAWTQAHTEVCRATVVRAEQSEEAMDLRMTCLHDRRVHLRAMVDELAQADAAVAQKAVTAVASLPTLSRCADVDALAADVPPPEDPAVAQRVSALDEQLAQAAAKEGAGQYDEGLAVATAVVAEAKTLGYEPLLARARARQGMLQQLAGDAKGAAATLQEAYGAAVAQRMTAEAAETSAWLVYVQGQELARFEDARRWAIHAESHARAVGTDEAHATYLRNLGTVALAEGKLDQARQLHEQALALVEQTHGSRHPSVATALDSLGHVTHAQGQLDQARQFHERALALQEQLRGPRHPDVANTLNNLGLVEQSKGLPAKARRSYERALTIWQEALGPQHPLVARSLGNLGNLAITQGRLDDALHFHERALTIFERVLDPQHPDMAISLTNVGIAAILRGKLDQARDAHQRARTIFEAALGPQHPNVATSLESLGHVAKARGQLAPARDYYEQALKIREQALGPQHPEVGNALNNLGGVALLQGKPDQAHRFQERALATWEAALGPEHPMLAYALSGLGDALLAQQESAQALVPLERALAILADQQVDPALLASTRFALARALWAAPASQGRDRPRARRLAELARDGWPEDNAAMDYDRAEVEAWLASR
ncbi:MAG: serine/threonine-protein kinase, partial [Myxococcota bacterium]